MSQKTNHRRDGKRHQDNGPTWEGGPPNSGCNSTHVAKARRDWQDLRRRGERRNGKTPASFQGGRPMQEDTNERS